MKAKKPLRLALAFLAFMVFLPVSALAIQIAPFYTGSYTFSDLGSVPGVLTPYGGLTLKAGDSSTLLIGGGANSADGKLYSIGVTRGVGNHITGFTGSAAVFAEAAYNDGGVQYDPGGVLFVTRWPGNQLGQIKPGSVITDKIVNLAPLGVTESPGGLAFVPSGFQGAGQLKIASYVDGGWYTLGYSLDGSGTYDITSAIRNTTITVGSEGIAYIPMGSSLFGLPSIIVSENLDDKIATYEVDANGNPKVASRKDFITGLSGPMGAFIDPLTGDFLFTTFNGDNFIGNNFIVVQGTDTQIPVPPTVLLLGSGLLGLVGFRRFRKS